MSKRTDKIRLGVVGTRRGAHLVSYCKNAGNAELVAVCDKRAEGLDKMRAEYGDGIAYYADYDEFLRHDMDAVVLANYANEHAPFAVAALRAGKHVLSEVLPVQTMKEAVELTEAVEASDRLYAYGENYCFMPAPYEIRRLYRSGALGEFEYGEGEYIHNCGPIWPDITYGEESHWRNNMYANFYCTHSIGPLIHITGLRPVSVVGFELPIREGGTALGCKSGTAGIEMITLENGAVIKSVHGGLYKNSIWYSVYGRKGRAEWVREGFEGSDGVAAVIADFDSYIGEYPNNPPPKPYKPASPLAEQAKRYGHGGSDFVMMYHFVEKLRGSESADTIGVYEALDMFLPGMFAYRSVLNGGIPMRIPDLRDKAARDAYRGDTACSDPKAAGDMLLPSYSKGNPAVDPAVYEEVRRIWRERNR